MLEKQQATTYELIDIAVPGDAKVEVKGNEKIDKYQDLVREVRKLWKAKTKVVPIVVAAVGTILKGLVGHVECIGVNLG